MYNIMSTEENFSRVRLQLFAFTTLGARGMDIINPARPVRVGLIGSGWYR
jgi:hypothetical protein